MRPRIESHHVLAVAIAAMLALALFAGCNDAELNFRRSLAVTAQGIAGGYRALDAYDAGRIREIEAMADRDAARKALAELEAKEKIARQVLGTAADAVDVANVGSKLYFDVQAKNWSHALQELFGIGIAVADALGQFGIKVGL